MTTADPMHPLLGDLAATALIAGAVGFVGLSIGAPYTAVAIASNAAGLLGLFARLTGGPEPTVVHLWG